MKKSQIVASALLASTLSLTTTVAPMAYAIDVELPNTVADVEAVAKTWDDVLDLLTSLDECSWQDWDEYHAQTKIFEANQNVIEQGVSAADEAAIRAMLEAGFGGDSLSGTDSLGVYSVAEWYITKSPTGKKLPTLAKVYNLLEANADVEAADAADYLLFAEFIDEKLSGAVATQFDLIAGADDDIDTTWADRANWDADESHLAALLANVQLNGGDITLAGGDINMSEIAAFVEAYPRAKAFLDATNSQKEFADDTTKVGAYYDYWMLTNSELMNLDISDAEAVNAYYEKLAAAVETLKVPTIAEEPEYKELTATATIAENSEVTVSGEFTVNEIELRVNLAEDLAALKAKNQAVYDIVVLDKATNQEIQPKASTATVTITLPGNFIADKAIEVYYYNAATGELESIDGATVANGKITFAAEHFSVYALAQEKVVTPEVPDESFGGYDDDEQFAQDQVTIIEGKGEEVITPAGIMKTNAPNTGAIAHADASAKTSLGLMAVIIATVSAIIAGIHEVVRRKA